MPRLLMNKLNIGTQTTPENWSEYGPDNKYSFYHNIKDPHVS